MDSVNEDRQQHVPTTALRHAAASQSSFGTESVKSEGAGGSRTSSAHTATQQGQGQRSPEGQEQTVDRATDDQSEGSVNTARHVSIAADRDLSTADANPGAKAVTASRRNMERQLASMQRADDNERLRQKDRRKKAVDKAIAAMYKAKSKEGVTLTPDVESSRTAIRVMMKEEERMALKKDQAKLRQETKAFQQHIDRKYGLKDKKKGHDLLALADNFYHSKVPDKDGIPEHVRRELTRGEMEDLRTVFEMFDVKGRGYITSSDVRRAASMLGFKAKKEVFTAMIEEVTGDRHGKVTFANFLQFVVTGQGDGDDPLEAILQCFRLLDRDQKGYLTAEDLREAADCQKVPLSNRAIREMIQEADVTGDAKITSDEFIHVMLQCSMFRAAR